MKKVFGTYSNAAEARRVVDQLLSQGYSRDDIKVVSNKNLGNDLEYRHEDTDRNDKGLWESIKDAFTFDEYNDDYWSKDIEVEDRQMIEPYRNNLQKGETIILVEENLVNQDKMQDKLYDKNTYDQGQNSLYEKDHHNQNIDGLSDEQRVLELKKEKLDIDKDVVETGEVNIKKVIKEEVQTIEVPVEKEEIIIEKRSVGERETKDGEILDNGYDNDVEEIHIPIREERVMVDKKTVVDDEVVIKKNKYKENETVTDNVRHEEIEVDGDAQVIKDDDLKK